MDGLTSTNVVLSDFGLHVLVTDANLTFAPEATTPDNLVEVEDIIGAENLGFSRGSQDYQILANGGWPKKALLGFETDDMTLNLVRSEQGAYNEKSTYWMFNKKLEQFKVNKAFFGIIIIRPVAALGTEDAYEARYWTCFCNGVDEGASGDSGREYTVSLARSGKPTDLLVTYDEANNKFAFALKVDSEEPDEGTDEEAGA